LVTVGFVSLAVSGGRYRWINALLRVFIGIAFVGAVCDRLGFFGGPGTPGVSWGNFKNFTDYTGQVNSFLPTTLIPAIAVIETVIEGLLGLAMLLGVGLRFTVWASAVLLCLLGTAMTISFGFSSTFPFAVFVLAAGALVMTGTDCSVMGLDALVARGSQLPVERK
jgi:hypothetical protein